MTPERFEQIERLFHAARAGTAGERAALLAETDPGLRREVESLLAQRSDGEFLDRPAVRNTPELLDDPTLHGVALGASLGPYRIETKLGEGGMGEVFRAVDTRLGRAVAVKVTREQFSARSEREARAISSLNHPNICTLYDVGPNYLVMELVEGETIAARLKRGPLPVKMALLYGSQVLAALAEAHDKGVVHRDLKPANIMIAKSGIKVLDFGLAKSGVDDSVTASGVVMGTPAYMAPEQREGKPADVRADIYSFGCILYEMLTASRVGAGRKGLPLPGLERIVDRCLETDPGRRWQSAGELEAELAGVTTTGSGRKRALAGVAALAGLCIAGYFYFHRAPILTDKDTIVLADFDNKTGDPVFDDTLRQGLAVELQQSPFLTLISDTQAQETLALMGQPKEARLTSEIARQVCERTASAAVLEGSIASIGSQFVLGLRAKNCATGRVLDQRQAVARTREDILNSLSQMAREFRTNVGESLATVEKHSTPLAEATTPSIEALKAYTNGMKVLQSSGNEAAIPLFRRAVEIDPKFALAHAMLGLRYSATGESVLSAESTTRAWQLRDRVSDRERFFIDFTYDRQVTGNLEKAYQTLELWSQAYPRRAGDANPQPWGLSANGTGRFERFIEVAEEAIAANPDSAPAYVSLANSYFLTGRFPEAERVLQRAAKRKLESPSFLVLPYKIAALKGDQEQMDRLVGLGKGKRTTEHWLAHAEALALARAGRLQSAAQSSNRAVALALQERGGRETAARYRAARAVWEAVWGNASEAQRSATAALQLSDGRDIEYAAGLALAFAGASSRSEALAGDLEKRFPEDTFVKFTYLPVLRALADLEHGRPSNSVEQLQMARRYEMAANGLNFPHIVLGGLHSAYVRGQALIATRQYPEAAAEFQKILNHRGVVGLDPIGARARLELGRAFALSGDKAKAKAAYESFLTLWKDADPGIPILKRARAEYERL